MLPTLGTTDKARLLTALKELDDSMTRVDVEKDIQKTIKGNVCEELGLKKKVLTRLAKVFHNQNFSEEVELDEEFSKLYETVSSTTVV